MQEQAGKHTPFAYYNKQEEKSITRLGECYSHSDIAYCLDPSKTQKVGEEEENSHLPLSAACKVVALSALEPVPCALLLTMLPLCFPPSMYCMLPSAHVPFGLPLFRLWQESDGRSIGCAGACMLLCIPCITNQGSCFGPDQMSAQNLC